jgi:hypothetical protein
MKRTTLLVAFVLLATAAFAHQDRILSVRVDGTIPELPPAYQTTRLHVAFSEGDAGALQQLNFLSSGRETSVKPCLLRLVPKGSFHQLFLIGSWYHDESLLPHYLQVQFRDWPSLEGGRIPRASASCSAFATPGFSKSPRLFRSQPRGLSTFRTSACPMAAPSKSASRFPRVGAAAVSAGPVVRQPCHHRVARTAFTGYGGSGKLFSRRASTHLR